MEPGGSPVIPILNQNNPIPRNGTYSNIWCKYLHTSININFIIIIIIIIIVTIIIIIKLILSYFKLHDFRNCLMNSCNSIDCSSSYYIP